jgi:PAS domain-containing protein
MDSIEILTIKTASALSRLAELQRRAEVAPEKTAPVVRPALKELSGALEELRVANEQLQSQVDELAAARWTSATAEQRLDEFVGMMPVPCVWTDTEGVIVDGNAAACSLLNISRQRLPGKPLILFITDRDPLFGAMQALRRSGPSAKVELDLTVRPRERRPRVLRVAGHTCSHDSRWVWFLQDAGPADSPAPS